MSTKRHCPSDYGIIQASGKYIRAPREITWSIDTLYFYTYAKGKMLNGICAGISLCLYKDLNYLGDDEANNQESSDGYLMMSYGIRMAFSKKSHYYIGPPLPFLIKGAVPSDTRNSSQFC